MNFAIPTGLNQVRHNLPAEAVPHGRLFAFLFHSYVARCQLESIAAEHESARIYLMHDFDLLNLWPFLLAAIVLGAGIALLSGAY
jgi:hypothetical protein